MHLYIYREREGPKLFLMRWFHIPSKALVSGDSSMCMCIYIYENIYIHAYIYIYSSDDVVNQSGLDITQAFARPG